MLNKLKNAISKANNIVIFSGAGISTDSNIPDFRSENGIYKNNLRAEEIISHSFFLTNTKEFYEFYKNKMVYEDALPNYGHIFPAELEKDGKNVIIVTQNIDGLHQKAGSKNVLELHGSIHRNYCMNCHKFFPLKKIIESDNYPKCDKCGCLIKPDVVLYEEALNEEVIENTIKTISNADLLIVVGTSLSVYPAASFIRFFKGDTLAIINKTKTPQDEYADILIHGGISETFKALK